MCSDPESNQWRVWPWTLWNETESGLIRPTRGLQPREEADGFLHNIWLLGDATSRDNPAHKSGVAMAGTFDSQNQSLDYSSACRDAHTTPPWNHGREFDKKHPCTRFALVFQPLVQRCVGSWLTGCCIPRIDDTTLSSHNPTLNSDMTDSNDISFYARGGKCWIHL